MRAWYGDHAEYVAECSGDELVKAIRRVFAAGVRPVSEVERRTVKRRFDWKPIVVGFWDRLLSVSSSKSRERVAVQ
jgi:hypothetical protein